MGGVVGSGNARITGGRRFGGLFVLWATAGADNAAVIRKSPPEAGCFIGKSSKAWLRGQDLNL
jgi:hypothetical protein